MPYTLLCNETADRPGWATGTLEIMGAQGDLKLHWDKNDPESVEKARRQFNDLKGKYTAHQISADGETNEPITEFDPELENILLVGPLAGG